MMTDDREQSLRERRESLGIRILQNCRNELYSRYPVLDGAFASLPARPENEIETIGTDGDVLLFSPRYLAETYLRSPSAVRWGYLHILLHCLFGHLFPDPGYDAGLWDLACDIAVEAILAKEISNTSDRPLQPERQAALALLGDGAGSAEQFLGMLERGELQTPSEELRRLFGFDDHRFWRRHRGTAAERKLRRKWERVRSYTNQGARRRSIGGSPGTDVEEIGPLQRGRYDYHRFLRRFTFPREELELDTESFDYIYYHLGMERYGNLPLIEPLEYKEVNRLEELVIAIDTSHSCSAETVRRFLEETYAILSDRENFFRRMKVYLIQCDLSIHDVTLIRSKEEWMEYARDVKIRGRSGTDFRPVFRYVEKLREQKELRNLRALIYFTDGDGVYPRVGPDYETAFVFLRDHAHPELAPPWAVKLMVD